MDFRHQLSESGIWQKINIHPSLICILYNSQKRWQLHAQDLNAVTPVILHLNFKTIMQHRRPIKFQQLYTGWKSMKFGLNSRLQLPWVTLVSKRSNILKLYLSAMSTDNWPTSCPNFTQVSPLNLENHHQTAGFVKNVSSNMWPVISISWGFLGFWLWNVVSASFTNFHSATWLISHTAQCVK